MQSGRSDQEEELGVPIDAAGQAIAGYPGLSGYRGAPSFVRHLHRQRAPGWHRVAGIGGDVDQDLVEVARVHADGEPSSRGIEDQRDRGAP